MYYVIEKYKWEDATNYRNKLTNYNYVRTGNIKTTILCLAYQKQLFFNESVIFYHYFLDRIMYVSCCIV